MSKKRIDVILFEKKYVDSRAKAQALIMSGNVIVNGEKVLKSGAKFDEENLKIEIKEIFPYVSRGALKLKSAMEYFDLFFNEKIAVDIGSSTGGFTDFMLQNGIKKVYAIDVGTNQLAYKIRMDDRVVVREKTNARYLEKSDFAPLPDIAVCDVSFISLKLIFPVVARLECKEFVALIKPQFEVGKDVNGFDGIVRRESDRLMAIEKVKTYALENGFKIIGITKSVIKGPKGNQEYLIYLKNV